VQAKLDDLLSAYVRDTQMLFAQCPACQGIYEKLVKWQAGLQIMKDQTLFYDPLYSSDISNNCPHECKSCSREHRSLYKKNENFKFKCYLKGSAVPSDTNEKFDCGKVRRRTYKPWQKKVWCNVKDWKLNLVKQARYSAMLSCSLYLLQEHIQPPDVSVKDLADAHKTCLNVEQGLVVSSAEYEQYKRTLMQPPEGERKLTSALMDIIKNLGVHAGLAQLILSSAPKDTSHSLVERVEGDVSDVVNVFAREFDTSGGDVFFVGPWDSPVEDEICDIGARGGRWDNLIGGVLAPLFRMSLAIFFAPVVGVLLLPASLSYFWSNFVVAGFKKNVLLGSLVVVGSPFFLVTAMLATGLQATWRLFRIADWDCDNAKLAPSRLPDSHHYTHVQPQCLNGMYRERKTCKEGLRIVCSKDYEYNLVFTGSC